MAHVEIKFIIAPFLLTIPIVVVVQMTLHGSKITVIFPPPISVITEKLKAYLIVKAISR